MSANELASMIRMAILNEAKYLSGFNFPDEHVNDQIAASLLRIAAELTPSFVLPEEMDQFTEKPKDKP